MGPDEDLPYETSQAAVSSIMHPMSKAYLDPKMPIRKKIELRLDMLRKEVKELEDALTALDGNPEFEKLHDILTRVSRFF